MTQLLERNNRDQPNGTELSQQVPLGLGIQSFERLRNKGCIYVDKTQWIHSILNSGSDGYFLARPRRFGKSLLLDTIRCVFEKRKELFRGLAIEDKIEWEEVPYPVLFLSMTEISTSSMDVFKNECIQYLVNLSGRSLIIQGNYSPSYYLRQYIQQLSDTQPVVVLIDEYDAPLLDYLTKSPEEIDEMKSCLQDLYQVIKSLALKGHIHFSFVTGITSTIKGSLFSKLNHLDNITFSDNFGELCGITQDELEQYFGSHIQWCAQKKGVSEDEFKADLKEWYNGYDFTGESLRVYNPHSILKCFKEKGTLKNYWYDTGTPSFLIDQIKKNPDNANTLEDLTGCAEKVLCSLDSENLDMITLMFQTGYLTIQSRNQDMDGVLLYNLTIPNKEVARAWSHSIIHFVASLINTKDSHHVNVLKSAFQNNDVKQFFTAINGLFANIPYTIQEPTHRFYHGIIHSFMVCLGMMVESEVCTNDGRIDMVLKNTERIWIIELKINENAKIGMDQIKTKHYAQKYWHENKPITAICFAVFYKSSGDDSHPKRAVTQWVSEELKVL